MITKFKLFENIKNKNLRKELKELLSLCTYNQQLFFKRMYSNDLDISIEKVIDNMKDDKIKHALFQVKNTLEKSRKKYNI